MQEPAIPRVALAIDCTTDWIVVAAQVRGRLVECCERAVHAHSARVLPLVDAVLAGSGLDLRDVEMIAFGAGPGSFTGVRIACSVAQGLALGRGCPLVPVGSLEALAEEARLLYGATRVLACLDARMREVYVAGYERSAGDWKAILAPAVMRPSEVPRPEGEWVAVGDAWSLVPALASTPALCVVRRPRGQGLLSLAQARLVRGLAVDAAAALPHYVRHRVALTEAERRAGATL